MIIKHYEVKDLNKNKLAWYGFERIGCPEQVRLITKREEKLAHDKGMYSERDCEVDCFLSVLSEIKKDNVTMMDLGTGWGEWALALGGVIANKLIPLDIKTYWTLAVESDPQFFKLAEENFAANKISGMVLNRAIGQGNGYTRINVGSISEKFCGSSLTYGGYFSNSKAKSFVLGTYSLLSGNVKNVAMVSIDYLMDDYFNDYVDLLVMDIQGAELLALEGAEKSLDKIDYMMIGTHGRSVHEKTKAMLQGKFEFVVDAKPGSVTKINKNYSVICQKGQDGILLCRQKSI